MLHLVFNLNYRLFISERITLCEIQQVYMLNRLWKINEYIIYLLDPRGKIIFNGFSTVKYIQLSYKSFLKINDKL